MQVLVRDNLKVVELRLHDVKAGRDVVKKFLTPEKYPNIYQYSDDWTRDCPGYTPEPGAPNEGYITDQRTSNYWRVHLPLWQKIVFLEIHGLNYTQTGVSRKGPQRTRRTINCLRILNGYAY